MAHQHCSLTPRCKNLHSASQWRLRCPITPQALHVHLVEASAQLFGSPAVAAAALPNRRFSLKERIPGELIRFRSGCRCAVERGAPRQPSSGDTQQSGEFSLGRQWHGDPAATPPPLQGHRPSRGGGAWEPGGLWSPAAPDTRKRTDAPSTTT